MNASATDVVEIPEPVGGSRKRLRWLVPLIAVVVVATIVMGSAVVLLSNGDLSVDVDPDVIEDFPAGCTQHLSAVAVYEGDVVTDQADYLWSVVPASLGTFSTTTTAEVVFEAGSDSGSGVIEVEAKYKKETAKKEGQVTVDPAILEVVVITPSYLMVLVGEECELEATAYDTTGDVVDDAEFTWSISGIEADDFYINKTTGPDVTLCTYVGADVTLNVTAQRGLELVSTHATVKAVEPGLKRTVDFQWYDMFDYPSGSWVDARTSISFAIEARVTDTYPYIFTVAHDPPDNDWISAFMRLDMVGRNMTDLNMNENPEFLPFFGDARGGNAELDWYVNYITLEESYAKLPMPLPSMYDGWWIAWNGTITLDEQAAKGVLNITETDLDDFDTWWAANSSDIETEWESWLNYEASNERLAIYNAYEYDLTFVYFEMDAEIVDDDVVITFDTISWGMEALMFRWMNEGWMPDQEWYMEDMYLNASIGPEMANMEINAAVKCALTAHESPYDGFPCWVWRPMMQDRLESSLEYPISLFDPYVFFEYINTVPGSTWYGHMVQYDYTPGVWNLTEGESLSFEWPACDQLFLVHDPSGDGIIEDTSTMLAEMTVYMVAPSSSDAPEAVTIDYDNRVLSFKGPFDMWTWSKEQTAHDYLADEWDRLAILPFGVPYIEFRPDMVSAALTADSPASDEMENSDDSSSAAVGVTGIQMFGLHAVIPAAALICIGARAGRFENLLGSSQHKSRSAHTEGHRR